MPQCGKLPHLPPKNTAVKRILRHKSTTGKCMEFPVWNELFTFSTGFSTVFVKKKRSFQRCFPPFPHSFPHPVEESPIQAVMDAAAFWKFVGKNVGILPFIKKKVEGFSLYSTNRFRAVIYFSPIWNEPATSFQHRAAAVFPCGKGGETCSFPHRKKQCRAVRRLSGIALLFTSYCGTPAVRSGNTGSGCRHPRWW